MSERTASSLLDEILEEQGNKAASTCTVRSILETMSDTDRADLQAAFSRPLVDGTVIADILKQRGYKVSSHTVQRHRRGACSCSG